MTKVTLVYPYFHPHADNSIFRFPPLGLGYLAATLKQNGFDAAIVDCTFQTQTQALQAIRQSNPDIIGIQSMYSMRKKSLELATQLRQNCTLLVAGGALPTIQPQAFLDNFDLVALGEGEQTMLEIALAYEAGGDYTQIPGIAYKKGTQIKQTPKRPLIGNLDTIPSPTRALFDNRAYQDYYDKKFGYKTTALMTSRGCPFSCDFCSRPIFGNIYRARSAAKVVDEVEEVIALGYNRIWFADDCFTLNQQTLLAVCNEMIARRLRINWECLSRVDTLTPRIARKMREAGCIRAFFGIESGNDTILRIMNKQITTKQAQTAVQTCKEAGIKAGAFFILGYPGENAQTILDTVKFASALPLDYLSFTLPYPIPGTPLYDRLSGKLFFGEWEEPKNLRMIKHKLLFDSQVSELKMKFAIVKGMSQFYTRKYLGQKIYNLLGAPVESVTDWVYRQMS